MADDDVILRVELGGEGGDEASSSASAPLTGGTGAALGSELDRLIAEMRLQRDQTTDLLQQISDGLKDLTLVTEVAAEEQFDRFIPEAPPIAQSDAPPPTKDWIEAQLVPAVAQAVADTKKPPEPPRERVSIDELFDMKGKSALEFLFPDYEPADLGGLQDQLAAQRQEAEASEAAAAGGPGLGNLAGTALATAGGVLLAEITKGIFDSFKALLAAINDTIAEAQAWGQQFTEIGAQADSLRDARNTFAKRDAAIATAESTAALTEAQSRSDQAMIDLKAAVADALIPVLIPVIDLLTIFLRLATPVIKLLGIVLKPLGKLVDLILKLPLIRNLVEDDDEDIETMTAEMKAFLDPDAAEDAARGRRRGRR